MIKIIIPVINTGIGNFIMMLPFLQNISENKNIKLILLLNKPVYKTILDHTVFNKDNFEIIVNNNISSIGLWINLRTKTKNILVPTLSWKVMLFRKIFGFSVYSKSYIINNKFYNFGIKSAGHSKKHEVESNIDILKLFYKKNNINTSVNVYYPKLNTKDGINKKKIIFIHPGFDGNSKLPKDWGITNWVKLITELSKSKKDYKIKIIIGPGFESKFKKDYLELEKKLNNVYIISVKFDDLLDTLATGEILINTDSGLGHMCGALGLKTITLFGPADEKITGVFSKFSIIVRKEFSKPCYSQGIFIGNCNDKGGLNRIAVDEIKSIL